MGRYDGHDAAGGYQRDDDHVGNGAGRARGLMGVAKDNFPTGGRNMSYAIGFAEVEVDRRDRRGRG